MADESVNLREMWNDRWDEDVVIPGLDVPEQLLASNDLVWGMRKPYIGWRAKLA